MADFDPNDFGPVFSQLIDVDRLNPLGPGEPDPKMRQQLAHVTIENAFAHTTIDDSDMARCCLSGLWMHYDFLDESHRLSQNICSRSGGYWHGIMHRREPDYGNAKYWFQQVGAHPVIERLCQQTPPAIVAESKNIGFNPSAWDSFAFVDLCQKYDGKGEATEKLVRELARLEWQELFRYCYDHATN